MVAKPSPIIAVLDEDGDDRLLLEKAFEQCRQDMQVHSFARDEHLLAYLNQNKETYGRNGRSADLIVLGLHLPWENTFDVIATIKSDHGLRHIPIIVLIGQVPDTLIKSLYDVGANTLIARPVLWDELVSVLKKTCDYWFGPLKM